jgi:dTDP-4-amino-4,6-dideoxygalactose transaminase
MDPQKLEQYLDDACRIDDKMGHLVDRMTGKRVAALVPVHLYGQMADMDKILELAERYNLVVIEDACQAHGAEYYSQKNQRWQKAGSLGRAAAFSFYPGKNLGACGEAGSVTTDDPELAQKVRMLRDHGQTYKYHHEIEGFNGRLDAIQAGILLVKLKHISEWTQLRRIAASWYRESLSNIQDKITLPCEPPWAKAVYHLFVVRVENRDELIRHLMSAGIATGIHYPIPIHLQKAYSAFGFREGDFPITERVAKEILSLPMFPGLQPEQQLVIAAQIATFVSTPCGLSVQL